MDEFSNFLSGAGQKSYTDYLTYVARKLNSAQLSEFGSLRLST